MSVTGVVKDPERLSMTVTAEYDVTAERAWQLWADPRQLESWWGPPSFPATFVDHDLVAGGRATYFMTGPEGERFPGYWDVLECDPPRRLVVHDGFLRDDGTPDDELPRTVMRVDIADRVGGVVCTITSQFASVEAMETLLQMGMEEGLRMAMGQIDGILAGSGTPA
jgi:uncharacterized protein YndB with AHSA1/START domain